MDDVAVRSMQETKFVSAVSKSVFSTLWIILLCTFVAWYAQYHWKRRKLYALAAKVNGPFALPLIGNALHFVTSNSDTLTNLMQFANDYQCPARLWMGQKLYFLVWKPHHMEIILNQALEKDIVYRHTEIVVGTGLFTAPVPKWRRHRKVIMPTFNQKNLDNFVGVFSEQSELLAEQLKRVSGKGVFNMFDFVSRCSLDIICETAMGVQINAQTQDCEYMKWLSRGLELVFYKMSCLWYQYDFIFNMSPVAKEFYGIAENVLSFSRKVVKEKRDAYRQRMQQKKDKIEALIEEEPRKRNTFLDQLIELSEGENFSDEELREEVDTFMIAGSETTASVDCFVFVMMGMYPDVQEKVYQEAMDVLGPDRPVNYTDLNRFVYLDRVIKEAMRIFPIGPIMSRAVTEDIKLDNCTLPAGSSIFVNIMSLHRDPEKWPNPLHFDPDRFLPEEIAKRHPYSYLPFLGGMRYCVGSKYAMMAMKTLITTLIRRYRFSTDYKSVEEVETRDDLVLKPRHGFKISIEQRT